MSMKEAVTKEEKTDLDMTSMIDVVFLLLIFFIATMEFKPQEGLLRAFLPKERGPGKVDPNKKKEKEEPDLKDITITLERSPRGGCAIYVGNAGLNGFRQLEFKLRRLHQQFPEHRVVINGKPNVDYGYVVKAINACVGAQYTSISFAAPPG